MMEAAECFFCGEVIPRLALYGDPPACAECAGHKNWYWWWEGEIPPMGADSRMEVGM